MATPKRGYTEFPAGAAPDVPLYGNQALRDIENDIETVEKRNLRGFLPASADLNLYISPSLHGGRWGTSGASLSTYLHKATGYENDAGTYEVITGGNGAVTQKFYPYAKPVEVSRTLTVTDGSNWTPWKVDGADNAAAIAALDTRVAAVEANTYEDADPTAPLESSATLYTQWGDSLTEAGGITTRLRALMPAATVTNRGISGQTASQIAARQGGRHSRFTVTGDTIPASGPVAVTVRDIALLAKTGYAAVSLTGRLNGVPGTASVAAGEIAYTFTRTTAGDPVPCPARTPFIVDNGVTARKETQIIWAGRNNPETGVYDYVMAMARHLSPAVKRFIVLSVTNSETETTGTDKYKTITRENELMANAFGSRFLDIRRWLIDNGLAAAGITPTSADNAAIAGDAVPPSLTSDGVHFTGPVQTIIADRIHAKLLELGWA